MKTVVFAENDELVRELLGEILTLLGYTWTLARNAADVLDVLTTVKEVRPALLILDIEMPGTKILIQQLKSDPVLHDLPIIGVTGETREQLPEHVEDLLVKPFTISTIRQKLARCL